MELKYGNYVVWNESMGMRIEEWGFVWNGIMRMRLCGMDLWEWKYGMRLCGIEV